jgi:hypothetical protein
MRRAAVLLGPQVPRELASLKAWWDVMDISATGLFPNGTAVTNFSDKSGNGRTMSQATANAKPIFTTNILNGRDVLKFDNTSGQAHIMNTAAPVSTATNNYTAYLLCQQISGTNNGAGFFNNGTNANGWSIAPRSGLTPFAKGTSINGTAWVNSSVAADTAWTIYCLSRNAGTTKLWVNGGASVLSTASAPTTPTTWSQFGLTNVSSSFNPTYLAECAVFDAAHSIDQINRMGNYLKHKWGSTGLTWATAS